MSGTCSSAVRERLLPYALLILLCGATALPLFGLQRRDSFPISTYPMFAHHRGQPIFHRLVAQLEDGTRKVVPPELVASTEVLQTKVIITRAVKRGKKAIRRLCDDVAGTVARDGRFAGSRQMRLEEVSFDAIRYFTDSREPATSKTLVQCSIPKPGTP